MNERAGVGRTVGIVIAIMFVVAFVFFAYRLYAEGERIRLIPVVFIAALMLFVFFWALKTPRKANEATSATPFHIGLTPKEISTIREDEQLHLLLTSKDCVFITALASELKKDGIEFAVLDQYAGRMMKFIPDMEMKVMVSGKDYEQCLSIAKDLVECSPNEGQD